MKTTRNLLTLSAALLLGAAGLSVRAADLKSLLSKTTSNSEWTAKGPVKTITGTAIYDYMDGAGEIPIACNYQGLAVGEYTRKAGGVLTVELYDMGNSSDAFGLYSMKRLATGKPVSVGNSALPVQAQAGYHELLLHKGRYTALLFGDDSGKVGDADFVKLANALIAAIPDPGKRPDLLNYLSSAGYVPRSAKYFHGKAAMDTVKFVRDDLFRTKANPEIAVASYAAPAGKMMVIRYGSSSEAALVLKAAQEATELKNFSFVLKGSLLGAAWSTVGKPVDASFVARLKHSIDQPGKSLE